MLSPTTLPAEWEHQTGVLISWPTKNTDWQSNLADAEATYLELSRVITQQAVAYICCRDSETTQHVQQLLSEHKFSADQYELFTIPYDDTWTRDYGPISVHKANEICWLDFGFNAWGGKYPHQQDNKLTRILNTQFKPERTFESINFVLEGGSIDSDGLGTVLTTSQCLLSAERNPGMSKQQIEEKLKSTLGIQRMLWLDYGRLEGDDTDAHIDTLARFCAPDTIAYVQYTDQSDPQFESLSAMERQLKSFTQVDGTPYRLIPLPVATACFNKQGQQLPASYANFLILNGVVLAPVYGVETDSLALIQLQKCFPNYTITPVQCRSLIEQFGSLHCITMQIL
jgi:agmatine deiminase